MNFLITTNADHVNQFGLNEIQNKNHKINIRIQRNDTKTKLEKNETSNKTKQKQK